MDLSTHSIIQFKDIADLIFHGQIPEWIKQEVPARQYAVIRRMDITDLVPIGLRGNSRSHRCAAFIKKSDIVTSVSCQELVNRIDVFKSYWYFPILHKLQNTITDLKWGITGSVGFEMATAIKVTTDKSDIDIAIYVEQLNLEQLMYLYKATQPIFPRLDIQIEIIGTGAMLLNDVVRNYQSGFLVRTAKGPLLCKIVEEQLKLI